MSKRKITKIVVGIIVVVAALGGLIIWIRQSQQFVFEKHLSDQALTIEDTSLQLKDVTYYIMAMEQKVNDMAVAYNSADPKEFWNTHYSAGTNSVFMRDYAKNAAKELCVYDYVMEREAQAAGISLTESDTTQAERDAISYYNQMNEKQKTNTGISQDQLVLIYQRKKQVEKYVAMAKQSITKQGYTGDVSAQLDYTGEFYQNQIRSKYQISKNDWLWDKMSLGKITVN